MISYRFQDMNRDLDHLLEPEQQYSYPWDLQAQVPGVCILEGPESGDEPLDGDRGEILVLPTSARWIEGELVDKFFGAVATLCDLYWDEQWGFNEVREYAEELLPL